MGIAIGPILGVVGSVVGGIVGGYFGGPYGAAIGVTIGGMLGGIGGSLLFPEQFDPNLPPPPKPRETSVQVSTYGASIPIVYESSRLAGNIIYMQDVVRDKNVKKFRVEGQRFKEYTLKYTSTIAVSFCEGPITSIARIWINNKIFADWRDPNGDYYPSGSSSLALANIEATIANREVYFSIYTGTETQEADNAISEILGATETPAYRGMCYIVFRDFPVGEYSGVPTFEIEIGDAWIGLNFEDFNLSNAGTATGRILVTETTATLNFPATDGNAYFIYQTLDLDSASTGTVWSCKLTINSIDGPEVASPDYLPLLRATWSGVATHNLAILFFQEPSPSQQYYLGNNVQGTAQVYTDSFPFTRYLRITHTKATGSIQMEVFTDVGQTDLEHDETINPGMTGDIDIMYLLHTGWVGGLACNVQIDNLMYRYL